MALARNISRFQSLNHTKKVGFPVLGFVLFRCREYFLTAAAALALSYRFCEGSKTLGFFGASSELRVMIRPDKLASGTSQAHGFEPISRDARGAIERGIHSAAAGAVMDMLGHC